MKQRKVQAKTVDLRQYKNYKTVAFVLAGILFSGTGHFWNSRQGGFNGFGFLGSVEIVPNQS